MRHRIRALMIVLMTGGLLATGISLLAAPAEAATSSTPPSRYVHQVCAALNSWDDTPSDDVSSLMTTLASGKKSPKAIQRSLVALYAGQLKDVERLVAATKAIGTPQVAHGNRHATDYLRTLSDIRSAYSKARDAVAHASASSKASLANAMGPIVNTLYSEFNSIGDPLTGLQSDATLASAIKSDPGCQSVLSFNGPPTTSSGLKVGDCTTPSEAEQDCSQPHDAEVTLVTSYPAPPGARFPGDDAITGFAGKDCSAAFLSYTGIAPDKSSHDYAWFSPLKGSDWNSGDREIVCIVVNDDYSLITGSVKRQPR